MKGLGHELWCVSIHSFVNYKIDFPGMHVILLDNHPPG